MRCLRRCTGSAPRLVAEGLGEYASPESILRAEALLLAHIGFVKESERLSRALDEAASRAVCDGSAAGAKAEAFGDAVLSAL